MGARSICRATDISVARLAAVTRRSVPEGRDLTLDLARVACVVLVVFVHVLFVGVGRDADGGIVIERTVEGLPWFNIASWIANIMPLFFVVGGFAARVGWRSAQKKGSDADEFVRVRLARLARPAVPLFLFFTVALGIVRVIGLDPAFVDTIAVGIGSPLWFLGAYLIAQALAPQMIAAHERWGWRVPAVLLAGALSFDALRFGFGRAVLGLEPISAGGYGVGEEMFDSPTSCSCGCSHSRSASGWPTAGSCAAPGGSSSESSPSATP